MTERRHGQQEYLFVGCSYGYAPGKLRGQMQWQRVLWILKR